MIGDDKFIKIHHDEILDTFHVSVQTVIESSKESFCSDLLLTDHIQFPWQDCHYSLIDVVRKKTGDLFTNRVIVKSESGN